MSRISAGGTPVAVLLGPVSWAVRSISQTDRLIFLCCIALSSSPVLLITWMGRQSSHALYVCANIKNHVNYLRGLA